MLSKREFWQWFKQEVQARWPRGRVRQRGGRTVGARLARYFSLRRLGPRDLIRYFYLSAARRASEAGQPRGSGQTPYEYESDLGRRFPDLEPDLGDLTEHFVRVRYSQRPVGQQEAEAAKGPWQRIKAALRRRRVVSR